MQDFYPVKCNLTELTTRSTSFTRMVSSLLDMHVRQDSSCSWSIGHCSSFVGILVSIFLSVSISPERGDSLEAVFSPPSLPFFPLISVPVFLHPHGGSWLGCLYLPAMGALSIQELAANSGSSWMSQAPNLHFVRQLLITFRINLDTSKTLAQFFPHGSPFLRL